MIIKNISKRQINLISSDGKNVALNIGCSVTGSYCPKKFIDALVKCGELSIAKEPEPKPEPKKNKKNKKDD